MKRWNQPITTHLLFIMLPQKFLRKILFKFYKSEQRLDHENLRFDIAGIVINQGIYNSDYNLGNLARRFRGHGKLHHLSIRPYSSQCVVIIIRD
ncbi:hypothetical protein RclHR1_02990016 [Rhizophagus clarus]|uniref:Uncharacterized protein n=1 Tax=Rhizophagus clarus TaxID=94130 RepID=A0A2Z6R5N9_9GLOM|nr:hypothetical protein RclHR1_02990016 [Rhizophagus clarus]